MDLKITDNVQNKIKKHAEEIFPNECCGFFYGSEEDRIVTHFQPVVNSKTGDQRRRFEIHPKDYMQAEKFAIENGLNLMGVYHSHPNHPAIPSEHDRKQAVPYFSYIIVSVMDGVSKDFRSWRLNHCSHEFEEEKVVLYKREIETIKN